MILSSQAEQNYKQLPPTVSTYKTESHSHTQESFKPITLHDDAATTWVFQDQRFAINNDWCIAIPSNLVFLNHKHEIEIGSSDLCTPFICTHKHAPYCLVWHSLRSSFRQILLLNTKLIPNVLGLLQKAGTYHLTGNLLSPHYKVTQSLSSFPAYFFNQRGTKE